MNTCQIIYSISITWIHSMANTYHPETWSCRVFSCPEHWNFISPGSIVMRFRSMYIFPLSKSSSPGVHWWLWSVFIGDCEVTVNDFGGSCASSQRHCMPYNMHTGNSWRLFCFIYTLCDLFTHICQGWFFCIGEMHDCPCVGDASLEYYADE